MYLFPFLSDRLLLNKIYKKNSNVESGLLVSVILEATYVQLHTVIFVLSKFCLGNIFQ